MGIQPASPVIYRSLLVFSLCFDVRWALKRSFLVRLVSWCRARHVRLGVICFTGLDGKGVVLGLGV